MGSLQNRTTRNRPIGIFDSGLGGLTVVKAVLKELPHENIVYFGDTARVPYGSKSKETVTRFSVENTEFLLRLNAKAIVVACNTSSSLSLGALRARFGVPIIGVITPGVRRALALTKNHRIGVIGTAATIRSGAYGKEIKKHNNSSVCIAQSCPLLVPLVEENWITTGITRTIATTYLMPLLKRNIDTLILGCTHYPLLKRVIKKVAGRHIRLVDSAEAVAVDLRRLLQENDALRREGKPQHKFFVSDEPINFKVIGERFLGRKISFIKKTS
jgi:glutamate racemase